MKKTLITMIIILSVFVAFGEKGHESHKQHSGANTEMHSESNVQTKCPVMGGEINKELYVDHDGKRVFVCCQMCINKVKEKPEKFISILEEEGVELEEILD